MKNTPKELTQLALDLTQGISSQDRFDRLLSVIKSLFGCDSSALLAFRDQHFAPLAINGLFEEVLGRQFLIDEHPRLEAIARAGDIVRFPHDSELPDPYDGLIPSHQGKLHVHACIGLPLIANETLIGALTIDGFDPHQFDQFSDEELRVISALAAASLHTALLMEQLERQAFNMPESHGQAALHAGKSSQAAQVEMIGKSRVMEELRSHIQAVAATELTVLITGETGVGKELIAASIHQASHRSGQPLIYLNCAALPESVAESELFGHVKGAFTGAISDRKGKFEMADGGTLFLDEVGELPLALQAKLLRVLQYGDLQRVGDDRVLKVNTRIVAATNRQLHEEVKQGKFRADLYHRLSVFPIMAPPLRERGNDIVLLAGFFIERSKGKLGIQSMRLSREAVDMLSAYPWPGNVRELEHAINRASVVARAESSNLEFIELQPHHFELLSTPQQQAHQHSTAISNETRQKNPISVETNIGLKDATNRFQYQLIDDCYQRNNRNWAATARELELDAGNLHRLAKRLGLK
ncbi:nitric oxide reductase transcriptional regulator NorR [Photobacterium gaetbulicola]|nr:nitric oxide reductase transcriptional regulator NorR [Photobacterium gaetbulicola]PSU12743.1 nitric oxide reductase transcriptional regulator NorR [Photobacterium gaetbulicola]